MILYTQGGCVKDDNGIVGRCSYDNAAFSTVWKSPIIREQRCNAFDSTHLRQNAVTGLLLILTIDCVSKVYASTLHKKLPEDLPTPFKTANP